MEFLSESVLHVTSEFKSLMKAMPDSKIADDLYDLLDKDIKTLYNSLEVSNKNDEIMFIPDKQYYASLSSGKDFPKKSISKVGRLVRKILKDNYKKNYSDKDIEEFVNNFKATWDKIYKNREVKIVTGDEILYWYDERNYKYDYGTLGNSCMRGKEKNSFMEFYAKNPDKISLVVVIEDGELIARALLWKLDKSEDNKIEYYLDRIYSSSDSVNNYLLNWVYRNFENVSLESYTNSYNEKMICTLNEVIFDRYPYLDTLRFLYVKLVNTKLEKIGEAFYSKNDLVNEGFLSNKMMEEFFDNYWCIEIQQTSGVENPLSHVWSGYLDKYIRIGKAIYLSEIDDYAEKEMVVESAYDNRNLLKEKCVFSKTMDGWILKSDSIIDNTFGIIHKNSLSDIVISHNTDKSGLEIYLEILNKDFRSLNIKKGVFNASNQLLSPKGLDIFRPTQHIGATNRGIWNPYFHRSYLIEDLSGNYIPSLFSIEIVSVNIPSVYKNFILYYKVWGGPTYTTIEYADIFDIDGQEVGSMSMYAFLVNCENPVEKDITKILKTDSMKSKYEKYKDRIDLLLEINNKLLR